MYCTDSIDLDLNALFVINIFAVWPMIKWENAKIKASRSISKGTSSRDQHYYYYFIRGVIKCYKYDKIAYTGAFKCHFLRKRNLFSLKIYKAILTLNITNNCIFFWLFMYSTGCCKYYYFRNKVIFSIFKILMYRVVFYGFGFFQFYDLSFRYFQTILYFLGL